MTTARTTGRGRRMGLDTGGEFSCREDFSVRRDASVMFHPSELDFAKSFHFLQRTLFEILKVHITKHLSTATSKRPIKTGFVYKNVE